MFEDISRHVLFNELHRLIERSATAAAEQMMAGTPELVYPPNHGFSSDEQAALASLAKTPELESACRKLIASASAATIFDLLCLADGVSDPAPLADIQAGDSTATNLMLHDGFFESYWAWRRRRSDPGWRLDTFDE